MKIVNIIAPVWDPLLGRSRMPIEGPWTMSDEQAADLASEGLIEGEPEDLPEVPAELDTDEAVDGLDDMTVADLGLLVTKEGVPLNGATKKAAIIAAIRAHRTAG